MPNEPRWIYDGSFSLEGGVDGGRPPSTIAEIQVARAKNATFRGGYPRARPKVRRLTFTDVDADGASHDTVASALTTGRFQGAGGFTTTANKAEVFLAIDGDIIRFALDGTPTATLLTSTSAYLSPTRNKVWFCQADRFLVMQDGFNRPLIWTGVGLTRSVGQQVPSGNMMAYGLGRLWVAVGRNYIGGDLIYSDPALGDESLLWFTENEYLNEGGFFSVPWQAGDITGLAFSAKQDTVSGEGSLLVFTNSGVFEFEAPIDRTIWKNLEQPLQRFAILSFGATSHESIASVNGDLFYRSTDGIRSFYFAKRDFQTWGNTPISREIFNEIKDDKQTNLKYVSSANWDNRMLMTAHGYSSSRGWKHEKLVSIDFDLISGMRGKIPPAWEGAWDFDFDILQVLGIDSAKGRRGIIVGIDDNGEIGLWELLKEEDSARSTETVAWELDTRSFLFGSPMDRKRLQSAELWLDSIDGALNMDGWFRRDNAGCWVPWARYATTADNCVTTLDDTTCEVPEFSQGEVRSRIGFPLAPDSMDETNCEPRREGYEFQLRLKFSTGATIRKMRVSAQVVDQAPFGDFTNACTTLTEDCTTCND